VIDDAYGETYNDLGHMFYLLTFPTEQQTWCYDFRTGLWHERGTWIAEDNTYDAWRPQWHCFEFNKHLIVDRESGTIYHMNKAFALDVDGRPIRRVRRTPTIFAEHQKLKVPKIEVFLETGIGTNAGQGQSPKLMLRASADGGRTWGTERQASAGRMGEYTTRCVFWRLGQTRNRAFELSVSDPVPWRVLDGFITVVEEQ
jgi:hypothetical protein